MKSQEEILFKNMTTEHKLEEVIEWITNDCWHELSTQSKTNNKTARIYGLSY